MIKIQRKGNQKLLILGAVILAILVVQAVVLIALTISYGKNHKSVKNSAEVQRVLREIENEEVKGLFFSMFSLDSYEEADFINYRGLQAVMLEEALESGAEVLEFLDLALKQEQALENVYIGLSSEEVLGTDGFEVSAEVCSWDNQLLEVIKSNPQIYFHMILEYPSAYELAQLADTEKERLLQWYGDLAELFTPQGEHQNMILFFPGSEAWLTKNPANYLESGEPTEEVASALFRRMFCDYLHEFNIYNRDEKLNALQELMKSEEDPHPYVDESATYVFFGDSVIGNYTGSMSIPGVVQGFSKAKVINCGYGGLHAAKTDDESISLPDVIDAFLAAEYEHFENLTFFISIGLNDYMSELPLKGIEEEGKDHFEGAVRYAVNQLREAYPDSRIVLMTPNFIRRFECGTDLHNGYNLKDVVSSVIKLSDELDVKCIDVYHGLDINEKNEGIYLADMCHPNEFGRFEIGKLVYEHLMKWSLGEESVATSVVPNAEGYGVYADATENLENNVFFDSLIYTGYNIEKHRSDGLMWHYVLAAHKRGKGWLSDITYNGGSEGYETTEEGLPDISFFEKNGLVCASYATYVYFNYLPNVANIDTSELTKPEQSYNADDWYVAAKDWVEKGYSKTIDFEASLRGGFIDFEAEEEIPIGSIIAFCDARNRSDYCSHVVIYAGYENGYHWVFHVGNENGPEFCAVERMHFGPDPQWPIAVITTPTQVIQQ